MLGASSIQFRNLLLLQMIITFSFLILFVNLGMGIFCIDPGYEHMNIIQLLIGGLYLVILLLDSVEISLFEFIYRYKHLKG